MLPIKPLKLIVDDRVWTLNKAIVIGISPKTVASPENKVNIIALYFSLKSIWAKPEKTNKIIEINKIIIVSLASFNKIILLKYKKASMLWILVNFYININYYFVQVQTNRF